MKQKEVDVRDLVQHLVKDRIRENRRLSQAEGLRFIAERLNEVLAGKLPSIREIARYRAKSWEDDELICWQMVEGIVESMTDQPSREKPLPSLRTLSTRRSWDPNVPVRLPGLSIAAFNELAKRNPIPLRVIEMEKKGEMEIYPEYYPTTKIGEALWFLWRFFFHERGWERLKRCPQCMKWFVDDTKNKKKERCSPHCTWQWWSRDRRKESAHRTSASEKGKVKVRRKEK